MNVPSLIPIPSPPLITSGIVVYLVFPDACTHRNYTEFGCIFRAGLFKPGLGALSLSPLPPPSKSLSIKLSERVATPFVHHGSWSTSAAPSLLGEGFQDRVLERPASGHSSWVLEKDPRRDGEEQYHLRWPRSPMTRRLGSLMVGVRETSRSEYL